MKKASGCLCESKNAKNITSSEQEKESTDQKRNVAETIPEANNPSLEGNQSHQAHNIELPLACPRVGMQ